MIITITDIYDSFCIGKGSNDLFLRMKATNLLMLAWFKLSKWEGVNQSSDQVKGMCSSAYQSSALIGLHASVVSLVPLEDP